MSSESPKKKSALSVRQGISSLPLVNIKKINASKKIMGADEYVKQVLKGDKVALSKAITIIESSLPDHLLLAKTIVEKCVPYSGKSIRIGITGVPGVGKSTFIEALGKHLTKSKHKVAVLAIDPSSEVTGGSILGDKTRMNDLAVDRNAYIRPTPAAGSLGGVARKTRETIILCEAAGFDSILVETVGVGQSETLVNSMVDFLLLLMLPGAGDELQGIKRGITEMANAIIINKADGTNITKAKIAKKEFENALQLFPINESGWKPTVACCSSITHEGIEEIWNLILKYVEFTKKNNYFEKNRIEQLKHQMIEIVNDRLKKLFFSGPKVVALIKKLEKKLASKEITSFAAAQNLFEYYLYQYTNNKF